ncbi:MAG TPA: hypothetical protein VE980_25815 [Pyrinomonadaceae bacterium]|nr:hypothetical protein [Pyrinomonadaceae bacterium]
MTLLIQKFSKPVLAGAIRFVTVLFLGSFAYVANAGGYTVTTPDDQVPFTLTGTGVVTGVTHLPGGLTQLNFNTSGNATHLGDVTGSVTRIQDNHGNFGTTAVIVSANGNDSVFLSVSGQFETSKDKCVGTSTGTYTVTGGTGRFANATGSGTFEAQFDLCADTSSGTYTGTISRPHSN